MKEESSFLILGLLLMAGSLVSGQPGLASGDLMEELKERLEKVETKVMVQEEKINELEDKVVILEAKIETLEAEPTMETGISAERSIVESLSSKVEEHDEKIRELREPPVAFLCSYQSGTNIRSSNIAYSSIF